MSEPTQTKDQKKHWADLIADRICARQPQGGVTCASGISPSGPVHIGNLRDLLTIWFAAKALSERGVKVRLIHSWDDFDRFRKVPQNIPESFKTFIGKPLTKVPDPFDEYPSYAARHEAEFTSSLLEMGITVEFISQTKQYESGIYAQAICEAVEKRELLFDILSRFKTQEISHDAREGFYPVTIYCEHCGKDTTTISHKDVRGTVFPYTCRCQYTGEIDIKTARNIKLPWKVDWAMRWRHEKIVFEPGGKDHATAGGSFEVSREISKEVFGYDPPIFQPYEFIGIKGLTGKMSGSSGLAFTPKDILAVYQPELLLWIFAKTDPNRAFDLVVDDGIYRLYEEFDCARQTAPIRRDLALSTIPGRVVDPTPFHHLAAFSGIVNEDRLALEKLLTRMGISSQAVLFEERLQKAINWLSRFAPEHRTHLLKERQAASFQAISPMEQQQVRTLYQALKQADNMSVDEMTHLVYDIPKQEGTAEGPLQKAQQRRFFQIIYNLLFGKETGPRLGTFFSVVPRESYLDLLNFTES